MNWGDDMPHPAAILLFVMILFPFAWWVERRDRKQAEKEADDLIQLALEHEQEIAELMAIVVEHDHVDAILEDAFRLELKRQQTAMERIYRDAGIPLPTEIYLGHATGFTFGPDVGRVRDVVFQTGMARGSISSHRGEGTLPGRSYRSAVGQVPTRNEGCMNDKRPLPKNWAERLRERLAAAAPKPALKVVPKGPRASGPHPAGDKWHLPLSQAEMNAEADGLLGARCFTCGSRIIKSTGELIGGRCGPCDTASRSEPNEAA